MASAILGIAESITRPSVMGSITTAPLKIYGNDAFPVIHRTSRPSSSPRARYTGFKRETLTLKSGTIRRDGAKPLECDIILERDVPVVLRDGVTMYTDIFRPTGEEKVPAVIAWSPYGKQIGGPWLDDIPRRFDVPLSSVSELQKWEGPDPSYWVSQGYAVLNPDSRGAYASEGNITFFGRQLAEDGYDFIEWTARQPWSSGKTAMSGNSWLAISQWFIAAERPPHLTAIAPWEGFTDQFRSMTNRGGIPSPSFTESIITTTFAGETLTEDAARMSIAQQTMNEYWQDKVARLDQITVPAYVVASYASPIHTHGTFDGFRSIRSKDKWLRVHNTFEWPDYYLPESLEDLRKFFDYYLKGVKNDWLQTPRVRLSVLDPGHDDTVNRPEQDWPVPGYVTETLHLSADGTLLTSPLTNPTTISYELGRGNNLLTFTHVVKREMELVGYMNVRLWVEAIGSNDMELTVAVEKRDVNGNAIPIPDVGTTPKTNPAQGRLRVSHRGLDPTRSTELEPFHVHDREELLSPGEIVPIEIGLWPVAMRFHPGEQLTLIIRPVPVIPTSEDKSGFGVAPISVPANGFTCTPGSDVRMLELGGPVDSQPTFVTGLRVQAPEPRNKGTHVFHVGGKYKAALLAPLRTIA